VIESLIDRLNMLHTAKKKTGPARYGLINPGLMKREYLDQLAVWFHAEVEGFKAKGASEDIEESSLKLAPAWVQPSQWCKRYKNDV
jgi:hypothetical protein